jgi:hypothetical protein
MHHMLWFVIGVVVLCLWLKGHWFGWALAFVPILFATQIILNAARGGDVDDIGIVVLRAVVVFVVTGVPCLLWGSASQWRP